MGAAITYHILSLGDCVGAIHGPHRSPAHATYIIIIISIISISIILLAFFVCRTTRRDGGLLSS